MQQNDNFVGSASALNIIFDHPKADEAGDPNSLVT